MESEFTKVLSARLLTGDSNLEFIKNSNINRKNPNPVSINNNNNNKNSQE